MKSKLMNVLLTAIILILAFPFSLRADEAEARLKNGELRVLTYNIHIGIGMDNKLDIPRIAEVIKKIDPDLVALQEVDRNTNRTQKVDQAKELEKLTGMHAIFGRTISAYDGEYGIAILSRFPILEHKITQLPKGDRLEDRGALETLVDVVDQSGAKKRLRFITTHFCHVNKERRTRQAEKINELFTKDEQLTIIGGDFNDTLESGCIKKMQELWTDATDMTQTFPSMKPRTKIDYIFYRPKDALKVKRTEVIDEKIASDHCPVLCVFEWK